jgi:SAM-dependent methyltransferase
VQPVIAKIILPWFGGSSAVWSTCMLFFQVVLLLGYLYAHWLHSKFPPRKQALAHIAALAISLATLPILPNAMWKSTSVGHPSLRILALLTLTVGLPYFLLSSTGPLLQAWYSRTHKGAIPYRLFALSNLASMLALLTYPFLVEPHMTSRTQALVWSAAYAAFAALCAATAWRSSALLTAGMPAAREEEEAAGPAPSWSVRLLWLGLAASASILLLAVTTHITQDVAAIPFLWILPLSAYLLSFILCFDAPRYYQRLIFLPLAATSLFLMAYQLSPSHYGLRVRPSILLFVGGLFVCSMVCHGELVRLKPHPRYLTGFYVTLSLGGALGGVFVGLVAPNVFHAYYEFPLGLGLAATVVFLVFLREFRKPSTIWERGVAVAVVLALGVYLVYLGGDMREMVRGYRVVARNFYGQLRVSDEGDPATDQDANRKLLHGVINHGEQMLRPEYRDQPVTYFCPESGIGRAMRALEGKPRRIGVLGLGCGTLAAYGKTGDTLRIYEINPLVLDIARTEFSYLRDTKAHVEVALGDARLVLESEPSQQFDLLVMDAFSGDSVPVHLITLEALRTYFRQLKPNGILAINISNRFLNLEPVMAGGAQAFHKQAIAYDFTPDDDDFLCFSCSWALIMDKATATAHPELLAHARILQPAPGFRPWTDEFSNMLGILK